MPVNMSKYPDNWQEIRERILRRAGGQDDDPRIGARCEWCNLRNYDVVLRDESPLVYTGLDSYKKAKAKQTAVCSETGQKYSIIVLTIAHLDDPDPMNCDADNLAALCQKCHNDYDNKMRKTNAAHTRRQKKIDAGQMVLELQKVGE